MTEMFLVLLASAWLVLLGPAALRARRATPLFTSESFRRGLQRMAPASGTNRRWVLAPPSSGAADRSARRAHARRIRRRKAVLLVLAALVPVSLAAAVALSGGWWAMPALAIAALACYVVLLVHARRSRDESLRKVRSLAERRAGDEPARELSRRRA